MAIACYSSERVIGLIRDTAMVPNVVTLCHFIGEREANSTRYRDVDALGTGVYFISIVLSANLNF